MENMGHGCHDLCNKPTRVDGVYNFWTSSQQLAASYALWDIINLRFEQELVPHDGNTWNP